MAITEGRASYLGNRVRNYDSRKRCTVVKRRSPYFLYCLRKIDHFKRLASVESTLPYLDN